MRAILCSSFLALGACQMSPQQGEAMSNLGAYMLTGQPPYGPYSAPRFPAVLQREVISGSTKICIYSRAGATETLPVNFTNLCPYQLP